MASVNYDDERFQQVTREQNQAIQNVQNTYNNMIAKTQQYYDAQAKAAEDYGNQQKALQQQNTDFTIQKIEQQKERAEKDYTKEQKGAYVDWQKQSNRYGVQAEQQAQQGLRNGGYSESSQVSMYNQYQNRVSTANEAYQRAVQDYDNSITEARLTNSAKLAEIAYNSLKTKLEINLKGFESGNQLLLSQINALNAEKDRYYNRWQDVLKQINYENELAEQQRRYEEQMAAQQASARASSGGARISSGSGGNSGSVTISKNSVANAPKKVGGKSLSATNDYIMKGNEYVQLYKTSDGSTYYWDGANWQKWSGAKTSATTAAKQTGSKASTSNTSKVSSAVTGTLKNAAISTVANSFIPGSGIIATTANSIKNLFK